MPCLSIDWDLFSRQGRINLLPLMTIKISVVLYLYGFYFLLFIIFVLESHAEILWSHLYYLLSCILSTQLTINIIVGSFVHVHLLLYVYLGLLRPSPSGLWTKIIMDNGYRQIPVIFSRRLLSRC